MVFPVVMYRCENWTIKKAEWWTIDAFELWCWRRLLRVPWTARRSNQSILKEISPEHSLEGLMLKLKLQYFGHLMQRADSLRAWCWERLKTRGGEGDDRGRDGWKASQTLRTWVWVNSRSWWWTGRPGMLQSMGSQRVGQDWATEPTELLCARTCGLYCEYCFLIWSRQGYYFNPNYSYEERGAEKIGVIHHQHKSRSRSQRLYRESFLFTLAQWPVFILPLLKLSGSREVRISGSTPISGRNWVVLEFLGKEYRTHWLLGEEPPLNLIQEFRGLLICPDLEWVLEDTIKIVKIDHQCKWWHAWTAFLSVVSCTTT